MFALQFDHLGRLVYDMGSVRHAVERHGMKDDPDWDQFSAFNEQVLGFSVVDLERQTLTAIGERWLEILNEAAKNRFIVRYAQLRADCSHDFKGCEILSQETGLRFAAQKRGAEYRIVTAFFATGAKPNWTPEAHRNGFRQAYCEPAPDGLGGWLPRKVVHGSNGSMRVDIEYFVQERWFPK